MGRMGLKLLITVFSCVGLSSNAFVNGNECDCDSVEIVSTKDEVLSRHSNLLGTYKLRSDRINDRPSYEHESGQFYLFYSTNTQGFWAVSENLNTDVVRLENQGDDSCPYRLKSTWRFADGDLKALIYDITLRVVCLKDQCSVANCGQKASCVSKTNETVCECDQGYSGNPYERCFPTGDIDSGCICQRLIFSTQNSVALSKHGNSYGEYFLYDIYGGAPVYQHFAGVEYLYLRDGNWLISDEIGLREAGLQNQGDAQSKCPYGFRTTWEYADVEQPGWQWVYDYTARLVCPNESCSITKCGFHATCSEENGAGVCKCEKGFEGNPYRRCYPNTELLEKEGCACKELILSSIGASALAQADKMGNYYLYSLYNDRPAYQHQSGLDYLYFAEGGAWVIGAQFGGSRVGIVNFDHGKCAYKLRSLWKHSVSGNLQLDESLTVQCNDFITTTEGEYQNATTPSSSPSSSTEAFVQSPLEVSSPASYTVISTTPSSRTNISTTNNNETTTTVSTSITTPVVVTPSIYQRQVNSSSTYFPAETTITTTITTTTSTTTTTTTTTTTAFVHHNCPCPEIFISSSYGPTVEKHGSQLGKYLLHSERAGRPVYKHESREQYLYYHSYSGGNWLINNEIGLLYGGIQNSKDLPICPYLINTVWQYGDSEIGGWVYDSNLTVTCPTNQCSLLKCGFRAQCMEDDTGKAHCVCRQGFQGDPKIRCFPKDIPAQCSCTQIHLSSSGPAKEHQRDKMGDYFLWGYYNGRPVYQHFSGLDFLYFHKNNVWGVGPKIGGNSAGLLNFGTIPCPYQLITPWEFGTKDKSQRRQVDETISLTCVSTRKTAEISDGLTHLASDPFDSFSAVPESKYLPDNIPSSDFEYIEDDESCGSRMIQPNQAKLLSLSRDKTIPYGSFPWMVNIAVTHGQSLRHVCSGVIINSEYVLTVASCLINQPMRKYRVIVADQTLEQRDQFEEVFLVRSFYIHDDYDDFTGSNDIALVKVRPLAGRGGVVFGPYVRPICLPARNSSGSTGVAERCEVATWLGEYPHLVQSATAVPITREPFCRPVGVSELCAGILEHSMECLLGKGSPLVCQSAYYDSFEVVGLISSLPNCDSTKSTNRFVDVSKYVGWIEKVLRL